MENKIAQWLTYQPRTRLVFIKRKYESIQFVDIGYELAKAIEPEIGNPIMPMKAEQIARDIIKTNQKSNEIFGNYVALENWGILLEPELKINLKNLLLPKFGVMGDYIKIHRTQRQPPYKLIISQDSSERYHVVEYSKIFFEK